MVKKIISFATAILMLCCMVPFYAFAETISCPKCGKDTLTTNQDISVEVGKEVGLPLSLKRAYCSNCHYVKYEYNILGVAGEQAYDDGDQLHIINFLNSLKEELLGKNATATVVNGKDTNVPAGGRGYSDPTTGTPNYNSDGQLQLIVPVTGWYQSPSVEVDKSYPIRVSKTEPYIHLIDIANTTNVQFYNRYNSRTQYPGVYAKFQAPISGTYQIVLDDYDIASIKYKGGDSWKTINFNASLYDSSYTAALSAGDIAYCYFCSSTSVYGMSVNENFCKGYSFILTVEPVDTPVKKQTNIIINNNTFNGNIYVDNTNKLTYIYPQYTINNETKISNNPIIYNEETKQYYTYDQTTNNYYYITYGDPAPTPTPSPSPDPGGSTPNPDNPSPSPSPSTAPGGSSDKETGGNSFFNFIFGFGSDTGKDENGKKGIIWSLISLLVSCVTFVVGMGTAYSYLFPFLPPGLCTTIHICVLVLFLFAVIKFIRSFI